MFMVYWTAQHHGYEPKPNSRAFDSDKMLDALDFIKELRDNSINTFVVMASENPNSVGKPGVAAAGADYDWTKRRNNERQPATPVRRKYFNANDEVEVPMDEE